MTAGCAAPLRALRGDEIEVYERDGVVHLPGVIPDFWLGALDQAIGRALAEPGPHAEDFGGGASGPRFRSDLELAPRLAEFQVLACDSPLPELAAGILRSRLVHVFYDQIFVKEPGTQARTPWHQDQPYWAVAGEQVCTLWLSLDPVSRENAVEFIAGSQRWPEHNPRHFRDASPYAETGLPELPDIERERERHRIVSFATEPGDCLAFQGMIVHGAPGNASPRQRRALAVRYTGDDVTYRRRAGEVAIPTRDPGLPHGAPLTGPAFQRVWPRNARSPRARARVCN